MERIAAEKESLKQEVGKMTKKARKADIEIDKVKLEYEKKLQKKDRDSKMRESELKNEIEEVNKLLNKDVKTVGTQCIIEAGDGETESSVIEKRNDLLLRIYESYMRMKDAIQNKINDNWEVKIMANMILDEMYDQVKVLGFGFQSYQDSKLKQIRPFLQTKDEKQTLKLLLDFLAYSNPQ